MEEAIERARPYAQAGDRLALEFFARLLARHNRGGEAFTLLRAGIDDWFLANCLVDIAEGAGLDEEAAALLEGRVEAVPACGDPNCDNRRTEPSNAIGLLAAIRERQGRVENAIALLHTRNITSVNGRDQLADLLARHDRIEELRAYAAAEYHGHAARRLAEVLEERGDVEGAIDVCRPPGDSPARRYNGGVLLSELLARHGRGDEAIQVIRTLAESPGGGEDWIVNTLCTLYADHGRAHDGLAYLDALKARRDSEEEWDFFRMRLPLMADCGLLDEAIEQARTHPEGDTWYAAWSISDLLAEAGRTEEAVAVLEQHLPSNSHLLARHLIDLGRIKDAVGILQEPKTKPAETIWAGTFPTEPPF
ncbi:tetratricopeptide repeat protein [Streptomyces sp. NPDC004561]